MGKLKLTLDADHAFLLWGIVSVNPSYRLCWLLNKAMDWNLARMDDISIKRAKTKSAGNALIPLSSEQSLDYPKYSYEDEGWKYKVEVIHNKAETEPLIAELRNFDYLLIGHGELSFFPKDVKEMLQRQEAVHSVLTLDPQLLKERFRLQALLE
jgi:hypothetical protein